MIILKRFIKDFPQTEYDFAFSLMTEERQKSVLKKRNDIQKKQTVLGEYLCKKGIADFLGIDIHNIRLTRTPEGKPFAEGIDVHFSISHSENLAVCAVSDKPIGIDCEYIRDINLRLTKIACTDSDREFIFGTDDVQEQKNRFFVVWTAKEAYFKFLGTGITNLKSVSYEDIKENCQTETEKGYMITTYKKERS